MLNFNYSAIRNEKWDSEILGTILGAYVIENKRRIFK